MQTPAIAVALLLLTACADRGTQDTANTSDTAKAASAPAADPNSAAAVTFAPSLGVDLAAMSRTAGGAYFRDLTVGTGAVGDSGKQVALHYRGQLPDGTQFDASQPPAPPINFTVGIGEMVRGFDEGTMGMRVGGRRLVVIPPALGYGERGSGPVPPNAFMVFTMDLVAVRR